MPPRSRTSASLLAKSHSLKGRPLFAHALDSPDRHLAVATLGAVEGWVFTKPTAAGKPVQVRLAMPIVYKGPRNSTGDEWPLGMPVVLRRAAPVYPAGVVGQKTVGKVDLGFLVRADGSIGDVKVVSSSDPVFENCALQALKGYRFGPRFIEEQPVDDRMVITIDVVPP